MSDLWRLLCAIARLLLWLFRAPGKVGEWLERRRSRRTREVFEAECEKIERDVRNGDEDAVNRRIHDHLDRLPALLAVLSLACACACGCARQCKVIYVDEGERAVRMEREGVAGWWLPDGLMADVLKRLEECDRGRTDSP